MSVWHGDERPDRARHARAPQPAAEEHRAPPAARDRVYRALVDELGLDADHRAHLLGVRGLPAAALAGFASLPGLDDRARGRLAARVGARAGVPLAGVPGFYRADLRWSTVRVTGGTGARGRRGILVPMPAADGALQGFQHRADVVEPGGRRYTTFSSRGWPAGCSPGVPASVWRPELADATIWAVEGHLKAAIAAHRLGACAVGVGGVANWRPALAALAALPGVRRVVVAYDVPDLVAVREVLAARESFALALHGAGYAVDVAAWDGAAWDGARAKGIDDALLAGLPVDAEPWRRRLVLPRRPTGVPIAALVGGAA